VTPFQNAAVARVFEACPPRMCRKLLALRRLIFVTAASTEGVGKLEKRSSGVTTDTLRFCIAAALTYHRDKAAASR